MCASGGRKDRWRELVWGSREWWRLWQIELVTLLEEQSDVNPQPVATRECSQTTWSFKRFKFSFLCNSSWDSILAMISGFLESITVQTQHSHGLALLRVCACVQPVDSTFVLCGSKQMTPGARHCACFGRKPRSGRENSHSLVAAVNRGGCTPHPNPHETLYSLSLFSAHSHSTAICWDCYVLY